MTGTPGELVPDRFSGTVAGIHQFVINVDAGGYFVSLVTRREDRTALAVLVDTGETMTHLARRHGITPGAPAQGYGDRLEITGLPVIHYPPEGPRFSGRITGNGTRNRSEADRSSRFCAATAARIIDRVREDPRYHRGFMPLLLSRDHHRDPFVQRAYQILTQPGTDAPDLSRLVGLGPGFTPAGDDFVAGALVAEEHLLFHGANSRHRSLRDRIEQALPRTTTGGATLLKLVLAGHPPFVAHRFRDILVGPAGDTRERDDTRDTPEHRAEAALAAARQFGFSSGLDMLAGILRHTMFDRPRYPV